MIAIRSLTEADFALIQDLARRIWPVAYGSILSSEQLENLLTRIYCAENLAAELAAGHRFWGAFEDGRALGYASGYRTGETVWIKKLYVLPQAQGNGAGRSLMEAVTAAFAPVREARLYVNSHNLAAQEFYVRMGFANGGETPVQMGDFTFTDYVFVKPL
jgi:Acetyltransferases